MDKQQEIIRARGLLKKFKLLYKEKKIDYYILKKRKKILRKKTWHRRLNFLRIVFYDNFLNKVFKLKISRKLSKVFIYFITRRRRFEKIYFRRPFIYEPREPFIYYKRYKVNYKFASLRVIKLFYVMYTYRQLKKIAKKAKSMYGIFEQNYLLIIECKLPSYIYRTSFFSTLFESIKFVKQHNVWVNKQFKPLLYYSVKVYDIVGFRIFFKSYIYWNFFRRLRRKAFMFLFSRCIYVSLYFMFTILVKLFSKKDIINAFPMDYYRVANFSR